MPSPDPAALSAFAAELMRDGDLTADERFEALSIARGLSGQESAEAGGSSAEAVRARRERIYGKLGPARAGDLISALQMLSLGERAEQRPTPREPRALARSQSRSPARPPDRKAGTAASAALRLLEVPDGGETPRGEPGRAPGRRSPPGRACRARSAGRGQR